MALEAGTKDYGAVVGDMFYLLFIEINLLTYHNICEDRYKELSSNTRLSNCDQNVVKLSNVFDC